MRVTLIVGKDSAVEFMDHKFKFLFVVWEDAHLRDGNLQPAVEIRGEILSDSVSTPFEHKCSVLLLTNEEYARGRILNTVDRVHMLPVDQVHRHATRCEEKAQSLSVDILL